MRFYEIDSALKEAIETGDKAVRVRIEIEMGGIFQNVPESEIIEASFYSLKEAAGGVSSRGEVKLKNYQLEMGNENYAGKEVRIYFSVGEGLSYFQRFRLFVDDKGVQKIKGNGRKKYVFIVLRDLSYKLRKTDEAKDWTSPAVFAYSVICDKTQPNKSLVHGIAQRAGLAIGDIDCSTVPVTLPYVRLTKNIWAELSSLATAYRCHLECAIEKPLVFAHSPYQEENQDENDCSYTFYGSDVFYFRVTERADYYRNTVRLKVNMPVSLEKQEIWKYDKEPIFYDEFFQAYFPFRYPIVREIENGNYEAYYRIFDSNGKERKVVYASEVDSKDEAESRLEFDSGDFSYMQYDVTSNYDKAVLTLHKETDGDLYKACIYGKPIILDLNRSCFIKDNDEVSSFGTAALNVTGSYFSEADVGGMAHYEDWVARELAERLQRRREFTVKTHKALVNARVGANVKIEINNEKLNGKINAFSFKYKREKAFVAFFRITEGGEHE